MATQIAPPILAPLNPGALPGDDTIALKLFDQVPGWAIVHAADDNSMAPLIRKGEIAVIESCGRAGWLPQEGGMFLVEHVSPTRGGEMYERRTRSIGITRAHRGNEDAWNICPLTTQRGRVMYMTDGPWSMEAVAGKLIGRVVGIYAPKGLAS